VRIENMRLRFMFNEVRAAGAAANRPTRQFKVAMIENLRASRVSSECEDCREMLSSARKMISASQSKELKRGERTDKDLRFVNCTIEQISLPLCTRTRRGIGSKGDDSFFLFNSFRCAWAEVIIVGPSRSTQLR
jgi:hypothetical protein